MRRAYFVLVLVASLALVACAEDTAPAAPEAEGPSASGDEAQSALAAEQGVATADALVQLIPAETPYAWVTYEALPFSELPFETTQLVPLFDTFLAHLAPEDAAQVPDGRRARVKRLLWAAATELDDGKLSADGLTSLGLELEPAVAIYGTGAQPTVRVQIADATAVSATIDRVLERSALPHRTERGLHIIELDLQRHLIVGIDRGAVIVAVAPTLLVDDTVAAIVEGPKTSLADTDILTKLRADYPDGARGIGFVDLQALAAARSGKGAESVRRSLQAAGRAPLEGVCADEITGLAERFPRVVLTGEPVSMFDLRTASLTLEIADDDLRTQLAGVRASLGSIEVPAGADAPVAVFSSNVDMSKLMALASEHATSLVAEPFECERLERVNTAAARFSMAQLMPFMSHVRDLRGGHVVVESMPKSGDDAPRGWATLRSADPAALLELAATKLVDFGDDASAVTMPKIGAPATQLPLKGRIANKVPKATVQLADREIAIAFGHDDAATHHWDTRDDGASAPLLRFGWNGGKLWDHWIGKSADGEIDDQHLGLMSVWGGVVGGYGLRTVEANLNERGVVLRYTRNAL